MESDRKFYKQTITIELLSPESLDGLDLEMIEDALMDTPVIGDCCFQISKGEEEEVSAKTAVTIMQAWGFSPESFDLTPLGGKIHGR